MVKHYIYLIAYKIWIIIFNLFSNYYLFLKICNYFLIKKSNFIPGKKTFLCIGRERFNDDINILIRNKARSFNYFFLKKGFTRFQKNLIPPDFQEQTFYQTKLNNIDSSHLLRYAEVTVLPLVKKYNLVGIISANFDYWQDYSFKKICKKYNLKFHVLSRENPVIPSVINYVSSRYLQSKYKFQGDNIMVPGKKCKEVLSKANITKKTSIISTGLPRFDEYIDLLKSKKIDLIEKKYIVLFSFRSGYLFDGHFDFVLKIFIKLSTFFEHFNFVIKAKDYNDCIHIRKQLKTLKVKNIKVSCTRNIKELLINSIVTINFNSLSVIDCLLCKVPVIIINPPHNKDDSKLMFTLKKDYKVLKFADNESSLKKIINDIIENKPVYDQENVINFVNKFVEFDLHNPSTFKVESVLSNSLK